MMHFGRYDSPILLECLGDLLWREYDTSDAKQLAALAYLKASYEVEDIEVREQYRGRAAAAVAGQSINQNRDDALQVLESTLQEMTREADAWFATVRADEIAWIESGRNADEEFRRKYYNATVVSKTPPLGISTGDPETQRLTLGSGSAWAAAIPLVGLSAALLSVTGLCLWLRRLRGPGNG